MSENTSDRRRRRKPQFNPGRLFANGEQGAWYDPSDFATLYQDSAGTTPVTQLGQPVGLMLDKSQGAKPGPELVDLNALPTPTIVDFGGSAGAWDSSTRTISNEATGTDSNHPRFRFDIGMVADRRYEVVGRLSGDLDSVVAIRLNTFGSSNNIGYSQVTGEFAGVQVCGSGAVLEFYMNGTLTAPQSVTIEELSVRELPGNHASQSTSTARPTIEARVNLLERTEEFDDASYWTRVDANITANSTTSPIGSADADTWTSAGTGYRSIYASVSVASGVSHTLSVYAKANTTDVLGLEFRGSGSAPDATFDLSAGTVLSGSGAIESVGNGWYRCSVTATSASTSELVIIGAGASASVGDSFYLWGAQLERGTSATTYQRVTTATDYADVGAPRYLEFDGVDDALSTASVDFSASDEMTVCAGVEAASASFAVIAALTSNSATTNGSWGIYDNAFFSFATFSSYGTARVLIDATDRNSVLTLQSDISTPILTASVNGAVDATSTATQGSGNFADAPVYLGARGGLSSFYNGKIHQLIIRGATTDGSDLIRLEDHVANKTGVTL